jgi:HD superfamily phosphohydrolase
MIVYDPIYGQFEIPKYLVSLAQAPEVRRLSQIRLLNTMTPSLATLGELRRFSHTLGILYLADSNLHLRSLDNERKAFFAAVLLHDIGTPPFGHLFEYHLHELYGWNHEKVIQAILWSHHAPEGRGHQIYARRTVAVRKLVKACGIDFSLVQKIIGGEHPLSNLLFGTLDFDNLDNVARMNWALGNLSCSPPFLDIAREISVRGQEVMLAVSLQPSAQEWLNLRRKAYEIIVFDPPTVAAQAVLSSALRIALEAEVLTEHDWAISDEDLIEKLLNHHATKTAISARYLGRLPTLVYQVQVSGTLQSLGVGNRTDAEARIVDSLPTRVRKAGLGYVFVDKGAFSKRISFVDPNTNAAWELGNKSESVVLYAFIRQTATISHSACMMALETLLDSLGVSSERVLRCEVGSARTVTNAQRALNISTSRD